MDRGAQNCLSCLHTTRRAMCPFHPCEGTRKETFCSVVLQHWNFYFAQIFSFRGKNEAPCSRLRSVADVSRQALALDWGGHAEAWVWPREGQRKRRGGKPGLRWAAGCPPVHSFSPCAAANTWWKVKVQWGVSIFARIMLCLSCSLSHTLDPPLFISLLSFPRVIHVRTGVVAPLSTPDPVRFVLEEQSIHNSLHFVGVSPASPDASVMLHVSVFKEWILSAFVVLIILRRRHLSLPHFCSRLCWYSQVQLLFCFF